jgi:hypothetical protein
MTEATGKYAEPTNEDLVNTELSTLKLNIENNKRAFDIQTTALQVARNQLQLTETNLKVTRDLLAEVRQSDINNRVDVLTLQSQSQVLASSEASLLADLADLRSSHACVSKHSAEIGRNLQESRDTLGANQVKLNTTRTELRAIKVEISTLLEAQLVDDCMIMEFITANFRPSVSRGGVPKLEAIRAYGRDARGDAVKKSSGRKRK